MKDLYTFDVDQAAAMETYHAVCGAYDRIFARLGLQVRKAEADTGAIGGFVCLFVCVCVCAWLVCLFLASFSHSSFFPFLPLQKVAHCPTNTLFPLTLAKTLSCVAANVTNMPTWRSPEVGGDMNNVGNFAS